MNEAPQQQEGWPFPLQLPPKQPAKPLPFNPDNFEEAPL